MRIMYLSKLPFIFATLAVLPSTPVMASSAPITHASGTPIENIGRPERARIEKMLDKALSEAAENLTLIEGQTGFNIRTRLVPERRTVIIDLGGGAVPSHTGGELEDQQHRLALVALDLLRGVVAVDGAEFQFAGHTIHQLRPDPLPPIEPRQRQGSRTNVAPPKVALAGGHGLYFNYQYNDWRAQRDPSNGITEDFITPYFARDLAIQLSGTGATVLKSRTNDTPVHTPSGEQMWKVAARYYLQSQLPNQTAIWNSLPTATHSLRERDEDIRSRPLYANYAGADYAVHLHTDAVDDTTVRGTRGYYQTGRTVDAQLASQILCSMKQTIQSVAGYEAWSVVEAPYPADKGENRLATMPSVIIELGFHTNASDALALQGTSFRNAAVKGIERGITDFHAGTACSEFRITSIPSFSAPTNSPMDMLVNFEGKPRFPVTLRTRNVTCAEGWSCGSTTLTYSAEQASPIKRTFACNGNANQSGTFRYVAWLTDASGIKTKEVEYTYSCTANA